MFTKIRPLRVGDNYVTDSSNETHGFHRTFLPRNFCQSKTFQGTPLGNATHIDELCENTHLMHELRDKASDLDFRDSFGDPLTEGRVQTAEFSEFFLVNVYTPNSKRGLERLELREKLWDPTFLNYLKELEKTKPVIVCGDFNAAHTEIDLARPESNHHNAGFTDEERKGVSNLIGAGFIDSFRFLNPEARRYTWWSHMGHARENNVGWRIDYFFLSNGLKEKLKSAEIYENILGSDHCPISIEVDLK
ncbi:MAG: exodeoxyribonuclease III [Candidatus Saccharibacteria bacterium]|nr:exodeoxyribonuclease III [Candidatus Saccharibacteria bacterium]